MGQALIGFFDQFAWPLQLACCCYMAGVTLVMQLIHYPSFEIIVRTDFRDFHARHTRALGLIAAPVMLLELMSAMWLARGADLACVLNLLGVLALWVVTFGHSVRCHDRLALGFDAAVWRRLLQGNRWRALLWSVRAAALLGVPTAAKVSLP